MQQSASKVKAIILDVDGVIIGDVVGVNSPDPHPDVIRILLTIRRSGIPIVLCTAKPHYTISKVIRDAELHNFHVTDGGALVIDPTSRKTVAEHFVPPDLAGKIINRYMRIGAYLEIYTPEAYFADKSRSSKITEIHERILQTPPRLVDFRTLNIKNLNITKIMPIAPNENEKEKLAHEFEQFGNSLSMVWSIHPVALPMQFGIITAKGITKRDGAGRALRGSGADFSAALGVGDSTSDWDFIRECRYAAAMGNATDELKKRVMEKGRNCFIGPHVNDNGIIKILSHFLES